MTTTATTTRTSSAARIGTRLVALTGATASIAALGLATSAPASARPAETASATSATADCNRDVSTANTYFSQRTWPVTGGLHMQTDGAVERGTGSVRAKTRLYNSYWGMGYTGATMITLYNSCDQVIAVTKPVTYGVDAKAWFWNNNDRTETHTQTFPKEVTRKTARVEVLHTRYTSDDRTKYNILRDAACQVWDAFPIPLPCVLPKL